MARKAGPKAGTIAISQTEDGLHLDNSILWFDSKDNGELSFLSSANTNFQPTVPQVIATEETVRILEVYRKKPKALVCQYNRPFSVGRLRMELLPSGCILGGASLYVETDKGKLLYAPQLQTARIPTVRQMQLKKANALVLGVSHPDPDVAMPNRKKEIENFLEQVTSFVAQGQNPVILCEPVATAQEITKMLTERKIPVAVHDSIFRVNRVYDEFGSKLGSYTRYSRRHTRGKVTLFPLPDGKTIMLRSALPEGPVISVEDSVQGVKPPASLQNVAGRFHISATIDGPEAREVVTTVAPKELYIFGPYAKRYVESFKGLVPRIMPLFVNDQPTLF